MAITNTRTCQRVEVTPADPDPTVMVVYQHTFDDASDDALPVQTTVVKHLERNTSTQDEDGTVTTAPTDVSGEDQMVQDICGAVWAD